MQHLKEEELQQRARDVFNNLIQLNHEPKISLPGMCVRYFPLRPSKGPPQLMPRRALSYPHACLAQRLRSIVSQDGVQFINPSL